MVDQSNVISLVTEMNATGGVTFLNQSENQYTLEKYTQTGCLMKLKVKLYEKLKAIGTLKSEGTN